MSWSISTPEPVSKDDIVRIARSETAANNHAPAECDEQISAAYDAAKVLAAAVGRPDDEISVVFSGHANPGHGPKDGYSDETITVTVPARPAKPDA